MRLGAFLLSVMLLSSMLYAQKRYVVSSSGDMIPIPNGKSATEVIRHQMKDKSTFGSAAACVPSRQYGNVPAEHPTGVGVRFFFGHKDLIAVWFETPASGTIDSVFIRVNEQIGDTLTTGGKLNLRIHHANVHSGAGPGWSPYVAPPKVCWGYFNNTYDLDAGLAAFPDDASDTTWVSTYNLNNTTDAVTAHYGELVDTSLHTFPPAAEEIWGLGGVEVPIKLNSVCGIDLGTLPPKPEVAKGYPLFITFRVPGAATPSGHPVDPGTNPPFTDPTAVVILSRQDEILGDDTGGGNSDPLVRRTATNWKFYEHPSFCGPGWLARGGVSIFIWYTMSVTSDVSPTFLSIDNIGYTTHQTGTRTVNAEIEDCNFLNPSEAGVASVTLHYRVNDDVTDHTVPMANLGGTSWSGDLPTFACPNQVRYYLTATDVKGNVATSGQMIYKTVCLANNWFAADTASGRSFAGSIRETGTGIDTGAFLGQHDFRAAGGPATVNKDDGSAGPFAISNGFVFFGDTMHYAWIGINGGIALSKTATDTIPVNSNGAYTAFDFPGSNRLAYPDSNSNSGVPRNFIAPFWTDLIIGDTTGKYGNIYYQDNADQFIVEWDSLGNFNSDGTVPDEEIFRLVLNKADGTIEFQYDNVGNNGLDSNAVVGLQSDSSNLSQAHGYLLLNRYVGPIETKPRNDWQIRLWPVTAVAIADGWNMVSAPGASWSMTKTFLFPHAGSQAFAYQGGYQAQTDLVNGKGYWMKYSGSQTEGVVAGFVNGLDVAVNAKWNMIGSLTAPVATSSIVATGTTVASQYFGYNGGYTPTSTIAPGKAYWVKVSPTAGSLHLGASSAAPKVQPVDNLADANKLTVSQGVNRQDLYLAQSGQVKQLDFYELPPAGPEGSFDARFSSGRMVETYTGGAEQYVINLQSAKYPVTVSWQMKNAPEGKTFVMTDADNGKVIGKVILQGQGSLRIENSAVKTLILKAESGINVPTVFALSKNYPNPFNPVTRMQLDVPVSGQVSVAIYDVLGRKVAQIVDGVTEAGYHTLEWNGTNGAGVQVPSGTYFVRVQAGEFNAVQKIMLMK